MAGELYEVFGLVQYSPLGACPPSLRGKKVVLQSKDGFISQISAEAACLSARIQKIIIESGVDDEICLPLKQSTMTKVIEYLKYHEDKPAAAILTPLRGESLGECGATQWDSKYISVDKEMLFELILAASILCIQSLFYLAGAKAALMTKDKPEEKLIKDFKLKNDLPVEEAEEAQHEHIERWAKKLGWSGEETETLAASSLAASSALLAGMLHTAAKNEQLDEASQDASVSPSGPAAPDLAGEGEDLDGMGGELGSGGEILDMPVFAQSMPLPKDGGRAVDARSFRHAAWRVVVLQSWSALASAPDVIRGDRELLFAAILASHGQAMRYASPELQRDRRLVLEAVKHSGAALKEAAAELASDRSFVLQCLAVNGEAMAYTPATLRADRGLILEAAKLGRGAALKGATEELQRDSDFVLEVVGWDAEAYQYADQALRAKREFGLAAARRNGLALKHMSRAFRADRQIVATAVRSEPEAVVYSHTSSRRDLGMSMPWDTDSKTVGNLTSDWRGNYLPPKPHLGPWMSLYVEDDKLMCEYTFFKHDYKHDKIVQFSASNTMTANMGQTNYIAANSFLDKFPFFARPEKDAITVMWGAVGGIGMRLKAFGSQDMLAATPEAWTTVEDASKILRVTVGFAGLPEWYNIQMYDPITREGFLRLTAGYGTGGGWTGENAAVPTAKLPDGGMDTTERLGITKKDERDESKEAAPAPGPPSTPLAGWPDLLGAPAAASGNASGGPSFVEGAQVMLVGLKSKNGSTGTLVKKQQGTGRWKIKLDGNGGVASLKEENFVLVGASPAQPPAPSPPPAQAEAALLRAAAAPAPAPQKARREKEQQHDKFQIVGSWSNWDEPQDMTWDRIGRCYKFRLRLAFRFESFQILQEGSWESCIHPDREISGAPDTDYAVEGAEERRRCRGLHWTIGNHPQDQGRTGAQYDVKLHLGADGKPARVSWRRVGGAVAQRDE